MFARQVLKLGSSLALTRILFPKAFGLVATAGLLSAAVEMCSDLGIRQAIVQHRRGDTRIYLDSAWMMAVVRGFILAAIMVACAWPFAVFFKQPILFSMVSVMSLGVVLRGFTNPATLVLDRNLEVGRITALEVGADVIRVAATIVAALWLQSVWGLVYGGLIGEGARLAGSFLIVRYVPHLHWDRQAVGELFRYGRFVLISGLIGYGATRLDALFVAKFLGMKIAGVYYIATVLTRMFGEGFTQLSGRVLFPALSLRQHNAGLLRKSTTEVIHIIGIVVLPVGVLVAANAQLILAILYEDRYGEAAFALRWLCIGACVTLLANSLNAPLMATGRPYFATLGKAATLVALCVAGPVLGFAYGVEGYAGAVALASGGFMFVTLYGCGRHGYLSLARLGTALLIPAGYAAVVVCLHALGSAQEHAITRRILLASCDALLLAGLWVTQWKHIRAFVPQLSRSERRSCPERVQPSPAEVKE
ncbi:MAG: oligosaccharide flippase family protein [Phycisphaerales bacterium]|nr:MAG: oligosaccharide flippase family protein [Phycisphaerales bacterium]